MLGGVNARAKNAHKVYDGSPNGASWAINRSNSGDCGGDMKACVVISPPDCISSLSSALDRAFGIDRDTILIIIWQPCRLE